jgi:hemoglobin
VNDVSQKKGLIMQSKSVWGFVGILVVLGAVSSASVFGQNPMKAKSLYDRLGGKNAISAVVDQFVSHVAADARINGFFAKTASDPERLKTFKMNLATQICEATGGPCKYTGKDMKRAHMGMGVGGADFDALVEDLAWALDAMHVGKPEKGELLGALGPMKTEIVEKP